MMVLFLHHSHVHCPFGGIGVSLYVKNNIENVVGLPDYGKPFYMDFTY